ncbi:MAG: hypothetical protein ABSE95_17740 [Thermodesulfobacteriota bacterium]
MFKERASWAIFFLEDHFNLNAGSPSLAGFLNDVTGSYQIPWAIALAVLLAGILVALLTRLPQQKSRSI